MEIVEERSEMKDIQRLEYAILAILYASQGFWICFFEEEVFVREMDEWSDYVKANVKTEDLKGLVIYH